MTGLDDAFARLVDVGDADPDLVAAVQPEPETPDILARLNELAGLLEAPRVARLLACHPVAWEILRHHFKSTAAHGIGMPDALVGLPVVGDGNLPIGGWEIRAGDDVINSGNMFGANPPTEPGRVVQSGDDTYWIADSALDVHTVPLDFMQPARVDPYAEFADRLRRGLVP